MSKLIGLTQLKNELQSLSKEELISLFIDVAKSCPKAKEFLTAKFAGNGSVEEILEQCKAKIRNEFFPKRGMRPPTLSKAKKAISDFKSVSTDKTMAIDIMLFYVECNVELGADIDMYEAYYSSAESVYEQVIKAVNAGGDAMYAKFADRLKRVCDMACQGWGHQDSMREIYSDLLKRERN